MIYHKMTSKTPTLSMWEPTLGFINPERMSHGNSKLKDMLVWDLPAIETCLNCADCQHDCYAWKAEQRWVNVWRFRQQNLYLAKERPDFLRQKINKKIRNSRERVVRIHGSGDFYSQEYLNWWNGIIAENPDKDFYAYTKTKRIHDWRVSDRLHNFNVIDSETPEFGINFGPVEVAEQAETLGYFVCPATKPESKVKCNRGCKHCVTEDKVFFIQH